MSEVSNTIKCRAVLALTIYKHLNLNNLVKHDQGFCELTHPKHIVLTQQSMVVAVYV